MNVVLKWSVVLAILAAIWSSIVMAMGFPSAVFIGVVIAINVIVIYLALSQTATENSYGKQLLNGALIGLVGGVLIFLTSWLLLAGVFPNYLDQAGMEQATPLTESVSGLIGTFFTSLVVAAILAIFKRRK